MTEKASWQKYTMHDLMTMQSWPLDRKIRVAQTRIIEWYQHWDGKVYVAFSGGKDSTVLLDLVRRVYPDVPAVFSDTGLEFPEIREFVKTIENVTWLKPRMSFRRVLDECGYPVITKQQADHIYRARHTKHPEVLAKLLDYRGNRRYSISKKWQYMLNAPFEVGKHCCHAMKKEPLERYQSDTGRHTYSGIIAHESETRTKSFLAFGCNAFEKGGRSAPLMPWTEQDILMYLKMTGIPYARGIYGDIVEDENGVLSTTGEPRTGCMFCAFGAHLEKPTNRFQRMKQTHPKIHDYCMRDKDNGGLGFAGVLDYINVPHDYDGEYTSLKWPDGTDVIKQRDRQQTKPPQKRKPVK